VKISLAVSSSICENNIKTDLIDIVVRVKNNIKTDFKDTVVKMENNMTTGFIDIVVRVNNIKRDFIEIVVEGVEWINFAHDRAP
jgi:hypothetical protein